MPALILVFAKLFLKAISLLSLAKALHWIFIGDDHHEQPQDEIGWFAEVKARPTLLIRPLLMLSALLSFAAFCAWCATSDDVLAANIRDIALLAWPFIKWFFIISTVIGVNSLLWVAFTADDEKTGLKELIAWAMLPWPLNLFYFRIGVMLKALVVANLLLAFAIYQELPKEWQTKIDHYISKGNDADSGHKTPRVLAH